MLKFHHHHHHHHFLLLLLLFSFTPTMLSRRSLHQPFFPPISLPPAQSPSPSPIPSTIFPKYPSSSTPTTPTTTATRPFFPTYPSPPPPPPSPPSSSLPTFPANISNLVSPSRHSSPSRLFSLIFLPLLSLALLVLVVVLLLLLRRRRSSGKASPDARSDSHRLFPPNSTASDGRKLSPSPPPSSSAAAAAAAAPSDFLYLGTLVNSRAGPTTPGDVGPTATSSSAYQKLGSPELRPLPPLPRYHHRRRSSDDEDDNDEFYSPSGGSPAERVAASGLHRHSPVSTLSTPSYPSSNAASSPSSSPAVGSSPGKPAFKKVAFVPAPAPPRGPLRPLTPSPPKRRPPSPSPPFSPPAKGSDRNSSISGFTTQYNPFSAGQPERQPPPPPPPPPTGRWESIPPVLVPPRPVAVENPFANELSENLNSVEKSEEQRRPKLKPLHWDKVRASSDRAMVWDQLKSSSFQLNEEMIETLFGCDATNGASKDGGRRQVVNLPMQENRVLDPKKSQNVAILLRALNVTKEEVCEALLHGNTDGLGNELLETLLKMAPSKEEEVKLKEYKDDSPFKLGPAEKFLKAVLDIPFAFKRGDAMLYIANFDSEVSYLKKSFETLEGACEELRNSRLFLKLLDAVLKTGNRMNVGTNRGDARAFKLDTLLKLVDIKGTDGKTTLLHFVVQEIIRAEGSRLFTKPMSALDQTDTLRDELECKRLGLQVVSALGGELSNVKKAAAMDSEVISSYVLKLAGGIVKIREVVRLNEALGPVDSCQRFNDAMIGFLRKAEGEIVKLQAQENTALSLVRDLTEYFHGNSAKEEAHPFRIFMVVRDFLTILDQVCKEVGRINERTIVGSARQFPVPVTPISLPVFPQFNGLRPGSLDDESS